MTEKYITYRWNGRTFDVPESHSADVEREYPDATIEMRMGDKSFDVPLAHKQEALDKYGSDITYSFDKESAAPAEQTEPQPSFAPAEGANEEPRKERRRKRWNDMLVSANDSLSRAQYGLNQAAADNAMAGVAETPQEDRPSWGESLVKGAGAGFIRAGKGLYDALIVLSSNNTYIDPLTGKLVKTPDYDTLMREKSDPMIQVSLKAGEIAERLSKEADPTGGEKGFVDLISEGKIGMALQKGLATGAESLPMTLSAYNPYTMALNMVSMAGANYAEQTLENPEVDKWKRATQAIGSAALEQAVEKFADPIFKYIGGKGAGEFTEEVAREILENGTRDATEGISKRILNVLKNTGKDALGEGAEEVITSFGNDALGEALDLIDGDKDYGIRAQWEQTKEENPDAKLKDFATSKAKEYMDSFIGGALSGAYMSGTTQTVGEAAKYSSDRAARNAVDASYQRGASLDYGDMYDTDSDVADAYSAVAESFTDENGASSISNEFIESMSAEDAFTLSRNENISSDQRAALGRLAEMKAAQEGLERKLDERLENNIATARTRVDEFSENGQIVSGTYNGNTVYVKGGVVKDGTVSLNDAGESGPVLVINTATREKTTVNTSDITAAAALDAETLGNDIENYFRDNEYKNREAARNTMSPKAKLKAVSQFVGRKMMVDLGNGITEVEVQNILPKSGEVVIKGKKGDLGGQSIIRIGADVLYDSISRDDDGNPMFSEAERGTEQQAETEVTSAPEAEIAGDEDFRGETYPILINGVPVNVEVISQDGPSDSIVYEYEDENGNTRRGSMTIGGFKSAIKQAGEYTPEAPVAEVPSVETPVEEVPATEEPAPVAENPEPAQLTPEAINWDELFDRDPEAYFQELQNQFGDETLDILNEEIAAAQAALDALTKAKTTSQNERLENRKKKAALQGRIDILKGMAARFTTPSASDAVPTISATPTQPTQPVTPTQVNNVPDASVDRASDARTRGFRMTNGQRVDRRSETVGIYGNNTDVAFTADSKGKRSGKIKVIDAGGLVPSHIGGVENIEHFIPEAQPKKRTDAASTVSASLIAQNMDNPKMTNVASSAYEGAPVVNRRGEVIQGNNRSAAILEMYQSHPDKAAEYKQYLVDHAADFGLNAGEVAAMQNPVLVRELDVDDADAITLGQYTMQDMESGGNQTIDSGRAIAGLSNKGLLEDFITRLLAEESEDASDMNLSDLITRNGNEALKMLYQNGIINQTQYQSALGANGRITADARAALRGIIEQQLFANGIDNLSVMFEVLPDKAKKAIMQTISRDLKNPDDAKVTPYLQEAIEVYYQLNQQPDFAAAKSDAEVEAAIMLFKGQTSLEEAGTPAEKYTNFAFELAKLFKIKTLKQQRDLFNRLYEVIAGEANIFGESEGKPLGEAVREVYGTNINKGSNETNGQSGAAVLEGGNGGSQEGQQGSTGNVGVRPETGESGQGATDGGANQTVGGSTQTAGEVTPVAPNPVANPVDIAQEEEKKLLFILGRLDLSKNEKRDWAYKFGKKIADMFATKENYEDYEAVAKDLGAYYSDFQRGVEESFANRSKIESGSPVNSVPLEAEPNGENNGEQQPTENEPTSEGRGDNTGSGRTDDGGSQEDGEGDKKAKSSRGSKGKKNKAKVADKYPARKGNATQKLLVDTFGFDSVTIPNTRKEILNTVYDFMMEMSKTLGISPNVIGQGGWLSIGKLNARKSAIAAHQIRHSKLTGEIKEVSLRFKYARLSSIAHEWWHSLDRALSYFETGKIAPTASEIKESAFAGRKEAWDAVQSVMTAINDSGYTDRIKKLVSGQTRSVREYYLENTEQAARAFDQYISDRFAAAGITIDNYDNHVDVTQPTAEEMAVIAPAFDNLFKILQEKEGKKQGTSVLYHIGEMMEPQSDAKKLATEAIFTALDDSGRDVEIHSDEETEELLKMIGVDVDTQFSIDTDKPIFLSNAAMAVANIKQDKATPEQWLKMIEKNGGLKAGEDKWMGLSDWLKASDAKTLTKQEVLDFINENTIRIEEVNYRHWEDLDYIDEATKILEAEMKEIGWDAMVKKYPNFDYLFEEYNGELMWSETRASVAEYEQFIFDDNNILDRPINDTRERYTSDGVLNKKEIAIIVPTIKPWNTNDVIHFGDAGHGRAVAWVRFGDSELVEDTDESKEAAEALRELAKDAKEKYGDKRSAWPDDVRAAYDLLLEHEISSMKLRKILFIDEIQSKRHQDAREQGGYRVSNIDTWLADNGVEVKESGEFYEFYKNGEFDRRFSKGLLRYDIDSAKNLYVSGYVKSSVPEAPFERNWSELAMKRMLRYAAENGYDAVAWTKGAQQADRYNIGNVVNSIVTADHNGNKRVRLYLRNAHSQMFDVNPETGAIVNVEMGGVVSEGMQLSDVVGKELAVSILNDEGEVDERGYRHIFGDGLRIGGEGMKGFYDKMLPTFVNKYGKKWGVSVSDIELPLVEAGENYNFHSVPVNEAMKASVMEGQPMFYKTPNGIVYGWTDGNKIHLTKAGLNPNTPIHEYTHLWAKAMMLRNPKGWNSIKKLLKGTPVWDEVMNDANYSNIHGNEDLVASEALSRISGSENAAKMERMAQQMIDEAKGTGRKLEARGLIQNMKDALNKFWEFVWKDLFKMTNFRSVEHVTDRVLFDLLNNTDLGTLSEGQAEAQIVTNPEVIAELEASPKRIGYRNVVQNEDGTFSSPMAYWLQSTKGGAKTRREMAKFELGKWEEAEENADLVDDKGHVVLVKPNKSTVEVAYDPYIHNRLDPVNLQFKDAWKRNELVYVETEVAETDLGSGYHADKALLPVGVHSWSNGALILSKYDKPVRVMPWEDVADAWVERLKGEGVHFDVVPPALRSLLVERGVEVLPPHNGMGKDCNDAYEEWKKEKTTLSRNAEPSQSDIPMGGATSAPKIAPTVIRPRDAEAEANIAKVTQKAKHNLDKFRNNDLDFGEIKTLPKMMEKLSEYLGMKYRGRGMYATFNTPSGTVDFRVNDHNAFGKNFEKGNAEHNLSVYVRYFYFENESDVPYIEFEYLPEDFEAHPEEIFKDLMSGLGMLLNDGFFPMSLKYATMIPHNIDNIDESILFRPSDIQNAAVDYLVGEPRLRAIENAVNEEAKKLGVKVTYKTRSEMPTGHKNDKGYYNTKTGEIVICTENNADIADAIQTTLHEAVAHKGLRKLLGDRFNEFINLVYESLDAKTKANVDALAEKHYKGNKAVAMEEYMASLAETEDFANNSVWEKIKDIFNRIINDILGRNDIKIGDNELRYILRASYNNMVNPRSMDTIEGWAKDTNMRNELGINEANTPEILSRTGIDDIAFTNAREAYETVTFNGFTEIMKSIMNASGFKAKAQAVKEGLLKVWNEYQMENQDAQQAVITGIEAIQRETGNMPIEDFENYQLAENQTQSRASEEIESFFNNQFAAIVDQINDIITSVMKARGMMYKNKKHRAVVYNGVRQYLIAKHGLERNKYYQNSTGDMRDYSGLTALFELPNTEFILAETMAQDMVDKFEAEIGDAARDDLWKKINAATRKTLRHAYESGLLSRAQHDKIRDMFDYYIPLRGFDETTAEDVYNYASYDGNRFQPAVREAHGRSSLAFDPISVIMNMAQSEIIQGNKNRVKQALYHFIGNRPNSLLTPRECWYVLDRTTGAFVEAYPDIANGETWEQFEIRMQVLEATGDTMKQKKGLNVGYRFQKPTNKDEHYIHLKINGVEHAIYVNGNPRLAEGVNGFTRQNERDVVSGVKKANRTASQLFTNYNYKFGGKNFFRDFIWAQTVMFIKESPMYNLRFAGNWFVNNPITIGVLMRKHKNGTLDMTNQNDVLFKEFIENGGKTGYVFIDALEKQKRRIDKAIERMSKIGNTKTNALTKAAILFEIINYANECIELTARFATYVTSRNTKDKSGNARSVTQSIDDAKSITTNFNRKGAQSGRGLIGGIANFMGSWNFFYNAAVQGVQQVKGLHNEHPVKTKVFIGGWVALGFMMPYIINIFRGDDDDEIYWNLPEYERKNNICVPFGKGKVTMTIPLSPIVREGYAIGVTLNDAMFNKSVDKDATMLSMECAALLAKALLPANPVEGLDAGLTPAENLLMFGTPDIADPLVEAVINKDWTGSPIEYRTTYNEGAPHYTKVIGKDNWKERVGEKLYKAGEDNLDSSLDVNLSAWEHIFSSGAGGLGVFAKDITNIIDWVTGWKAPERLNDIPVARTLFSSNAMDDEKFVNNIYWDMDKVYKKKTKVMNSVYRLTEKEAFVDEEGKGESNLVKVYEAKSYPFLKRYYELNKELKKMQTTINKMPNDTESEKNDKAIAEQDLFNKKSKMVYELLNYEID